MANLHARWHGVRLMGLAPERWLAELNEEFQRIHAGKPFISMAFALANRKQARSSSPARPQPGAAGQRP